MALAGEAGVLRRGGGGGMGVEGRGGFYSFPEPSLETLELDTRHQNITHAWRPLAGSADLCRGGRFFPL